MACAIKKTLRASEQDRPDVHEQRILWRTTQPEWDPSRLVFIDETSLNTKQIRLYGRAQGGARCQDQHPHGHWHSSTFLAALRHDRVTAPTVFDGAMNGECFVAYVQQQLVPTLKPGDIVICDNLASHKVAGVREAIQAAQAQIRYLPPYSPDLNPIEQLFSKLKADLRRLAARSFDALIEALNQSLDTVTTHLCRNLFKNACYAAT